MPYQFLGWAAFEDKAAHALGLSPEQYVRRYVVSDPGLKDCNSLVSQACNPGLTGPQRDETLSAARKVRNALAVALATADAILDDVTRGLAPPPAAAAPKPTPKPKGND